LGALLLRCGVACLNELLLDELGKLKLGGVSVNPCLKVVGLFNFGVVLKVEGSGLGEEFSS